MNTVLKSMGFGRKPSPFIIFIMAVFLSACSLTAAEAPSLSVVPEPSPVDTQAENVPELLVVPKEEPAATVNTAPEEGAKSKREKAISSYDDVRAFMAEMEKKHQIDSKTLQNTFDKTKFDYSIIDLMERPAEKRSWTYYYNALVTKQRISEGSVYLKTYKTAFDSAVKTYKVPASVIAAVIGIETTYGKVTLRRTAVQGLSTLAFEYPRRADYFRGELESLLILAKEQKTDPLVYMGSYAGAVGIPQFMPSNIRRYAQDGNGDGVLDIVTTHADAIASIGNYLRVHGWLEGKSTVTLVTLDKEVAESAFTTNICATSGKKTVKQLREMGVGIPEQYKDDEKGFLVRLEEEDEEKTFQPAVFFENACPIFKYNRSLKYTAAIALLAQEYK